MLESVTEWPSASWSVDRFENPECGLCWTGTTPGPPSGKPGVVVKPGDGAIPWASQKTLPREHTTPSLLGLCPGALQRGRPTDAQRPGLATETSQSGGKNQRILAAEKFC
jgi:hypothetical protein